MTYRRNDPNPFLLFLVILCVIGVFFLKERLNLAKVVATIVTLSGAILLRLAR